MKETYALRVYKIIWLSINFVICYISALVPLIDELTKYFHRMNSPVSMIFIDLNGCSYSKSKSRMKLSTQFNSVALSQSRLCPMALFRRSTGIFQYRRYFENFRTIKENQNTKIETRFKLSNSLESNINEYKAFEYSKMMLSSKISLWKTSSELRCKTMKKLLIFLALKLLTGCSVEQFHWHCFLTK